MILPSGIKVVTPSITASPDMDRDQQRLQPLEFHPRFLGVKMANVCCVEKKMPICSLLFWVRKIRNIR